MRPGSDHVTELPSVAALARSRLYAEELGIDLAGGGEPALFRWFLASLLFGGRIGESVAERTWHAFARHGLSSPESILAAGFEFLVDPVMREGGYVRYDGRKSRQILQDCRTLVETYGGRLSMLHAAARDPADLEARLGAFHGIGPVTTNIFLRELRPYWAKADPAPLPEVQALAQQVGVDLAAWPRKSLTFARVEAGLIRLRHLLRHWRAGSAGSTEAVPLARELAR